MSEFTPGPWIDWDTLEWLRDPHELLESTGNARLMAAAPAMLHALMAALEPAGDTPDEVRAEMRAAVRLALGDVTASDRTPK